MGADIVERLEARLALRAEPPEWANPPVYVDSTECRAVLREAAAEIGRLRGEVDSLRGWFDASRAPSNMSDDHDDAAGDDADDIAPAEAKGPAPAMPNGVEELVAGVRALSDRWKSKTIDGEPVPQKQHVQLLGCAGMLDSLLDNYRAADNRDAAGVCSCPSGDGSLRWPCPQHPPESTPAAVPAGEAVAVCGTCNGVGMIGGHRGQTPDSFEQWAEDCPDCTPQPADGEAVDLSNWAAHYSINPAAAEALRSIIRPPAPVQAAPQEGEADGDSRASFERWAKSRLYSTQRSAVVTDGYVIGEVNMLWLAWQAALAAHHSACELGASEIKKARAIIDHVIHNEDGVYRLTEAHDLLTAALQHRGDSRGGEG